MASQSQLYAALVAAGMPASRARIGAAVAMGESGGNLSAHNAKAPDDSYGPWQINMRGALGTARRATYGLTSNAQLYDLATSARVAKGISSNGVNWRPWSAFASGAYKTYLGAPVAAAPVTADPAGFHIPLPSVPGLGTITAPFKAFGKIVDAVEKTAGWLSNSENWLRILYVLGGTFTVGIGLTMYLRSTSLGKSVTKVAKKAPGLAAVA